MFRNDRKREQIFPKVNSARQGLKSLSHFPAANELTHFLHIPRSISPKSCCTLYTEANTTPMMTHWAVTTYKTWRLRYPVTISMSSKKAIKIQHMSMKSPTEAKPQSKDSQGIFVCLKYYCSQDMRPFRNTLVWRCFMDWHSGVKRHVFQKYSGVNILHFLTNWSIE